MIESVKIVAVAVLVILTLSTLIPFVPSGILACLTVSGYWWLTGFSEPNILVVVSLSLVGIIATVTDFVSGALSGKIAGSSNVSVLIGTLIGTILLFAVGPVGFLLGIALSVFLFSLYRENDDIKTALKKSSYTALGVLASKLIQFLLLSIITLSFTFFILV